MYVMTSIPDPIFVRGLSRSGGTLLCTLLDAHADVAMSYELYPNLLTTGPEMDLQALAMSIAKARTNSVVNQQAPTKQFATFVIRCERSGLSRRDFADLLLRLIGEGHDLANPDGRMRLIELCALEKMQRLGKRRWGMKCNNAYADYLRLWPQACFLNVLRDGRDVLASQLHTGSFNKAPREVAEGWLHTHAVFEELVQRHDVRAQVVRYEKLTGNPEVELRIICAFLGLQFDPAMLRHNELDLTVYNASHLSRNRIIHKIDTTKIGRWKTDISAEQLSEFMAVAGDGLRRYGYL
jgi:hypothetical protein